MTSKKLQAIAEDLYQAIKWANFSHIKQTGQPTFHMMTAMVRYEQYAGSTKTKKKSKCVCGVEDLWCAKHNGPHPLTFNTVLSGGAAGE